MKIVILTTKGFKYRGEKISQDGLFVEIDDCREGIIKVPIQTISYMKEVGE